MSGSTTEAVIFALENPVCFIPRALFEKLVSAIYHYKTIKSMTHDSLKTPLTVKNAESLSPSRSRLCLFRYNRTTIHTNIRRTAKPAIQIPINAITGSVSDPIFTLGLDAPVSRCTSCCGGSEGAILAALIKREIERSEGI